MNGKRRILHIFPGFDVGGVQLRISSVLNRFPDRYSHVIVATNGRFDCLSRISEDVDAEPLLPNVAKGSSHVSLRGISRHLATIQPDLLVTYNWGSIEWALVNRFRRHLPHVHVESGFGPDEVHRQIGRRVLTRRLALGRTLKIVVPSLNLQSIARNIWRLPDDKILYVANGVDLDRFSQPPDQSILSDMGHQPGTPVIGTVAPLRPEKNLFRLINAFARLLASRPAKLLLVGDGSDRAALEALAEELGISQHVHFTGYMENPEKAFGLMDIYAISSDTEQMPNALIQAMAASRPVVGMNVGDIAYIVSDENQPFIAPAADDAAFAAALERMSGDAGQRAEIGQANLRRVREKFDQDRMFETYRRIFDGEIV